METQPRETEQPGDGARSSSPAHERQLLRGLMDNIPDLIYFKDARSRFITVNPALAAWFGVKDPAQLVGKSDFDFFAREHAQWTYEAEQEVMRSGQPIVGHEGKQTWPDGRVTWVSSTKVPLRDEQGRIIGTFGISRDITERKHAQQQLTRYAEELSRRNKQMQEDIRMACETQMMLLPQQYPSFPPTVPSKESALRFIHRYQPTAALGGDFFDVLALSDTRAGVFICDVMGCGVRAALVTAILRSLVVQLTAIADDPGAFLMGINRSLLSILHQAGTPVFASAFYVVVDVAKGEMWYANAGHPAPFALRRASGRVERLNAGGTKPGPALGLLEDAQYPITHSPLAEKDLVFLFTDGLYEVDDGDAEQFGQTRLALAVEKRGQLPATELFDGLMTEIQEFSHTKEFTDDVCLLGVEVIRTGKF